MLLQKALRELDEEIGRLTEIRAIVAGLHTTTPYVIEAPVPAWEVVNAQESATEDVMPLASPAKQVVETPGKSEDLPRELPVKPQRRLRMERGTRVRRSIAPAARALGGQIPARPVFIAPADAESAAKAFAAGRLALAAKKPEPTLAAEGTLDALLRELSHRPSPGF